MSASRRLAKLKRGTMVKDVSTTNINTNVKNVLNEGSQETEKLVRPVTILRWHEQRLNKLDDDLNEIKETTNQELIVSLVETIEQMDNKLTLLQRAYDSLLEKIEQNNVKTEVENEVKERLNTVKLNISEKN
jgi:hypothetical protein|tara:strand:+ start:34 stop:429 length:396 start_codon:yes stop_codon:yes gene_type:complete